MKIAIIGHKRIPSNEGGIEKGVEMHAVRMAARGHKVVAYNRGSNNIFGREFNEKPIKSYKGVKIVTVPTTDGRLSVPLYSFLATLHAAFARYDVVSYRASGSCIMIPLAKLFGLRCVASLHGIDSLRDKWGGFAKRFLELGERMAAKHADVCLVLSQNMKEYIKEKYGTEAVLFANGIDKPVKKEPNIIKEKFGLEKDSYILSLGRIVPEKGLHHLIEGFKGVKTDKKLVIAGGAEHGSGYFDKLKKMAEGDERIVFIGFVKGEVIDELYSNCYMFVLPSNLEGMANTLLEAMSFGCCTLASDIPENAEVVEDMAPLFKNRNDDDIRDRIQYFIDNPSEVMRYREGASDYITSKYNWDRVVDQMLEIYSGNTVEYSDIIGKGVGV
ncbi:MAG: glycosyltransferase family 4 protein [Eubacterium sp.]|nr:glycosyltransferase family 4 protein [Eubacterium sp.]